MVISGHTHTHPCRCHPWMLFKYWRGKDFSMITIISHTPPHNTYQGWSGLHPGTASRAPNSSSQNQGEPQYQHIMMKRHDGTNSIQGPTPLCISVTANGEISSPVILAFGMERLLLPQNTHTGVGGSQIPGDCPRRYRLKAWSHAFLLPNFDPELTWKAKPLPARSSRLLFSCVSSVFSSASLFSGSSCLKNKKSR